MMPGKGVTPGEGDGAWRGGDSARRRGWCQEEDDVTEAALCSGWF